MAIETSQSLCLVGTEIQISYDKHYRAMREGWVRRGNL